MDRSNQYELAYGDNIYEGNLQDVGGNCTKHPGHKEFIPKKDLTLSHLPLEYQHEDVLEYMNKWADLHVLIRTKFVSPGRPDGLPGCQFRGREQLLTGTGWCSSVKRYEKTDWSWLEVHVQTAAHVVCDNLEAANSEVVFFYDDVGSQTVTIHGTRVSYVDIDKDRCLLVFIIREGNMDEFTNRLEGLWQDLEKVTDELRKKYWKKERADQCVIISHPHGSTKQISFGEMLKVDRKIKRRRPEIFYEYDTPTCPGSSGACVKWFCFGLGLYGPPHSRCGDNGLGWTGKLL